MKINVDNYHLLVNTRDKVNLRTDNINICNSKCQKLLGVKFDHKLTFDDHIAESCKTTSQKIHSQERVTLYLNISKNYILMNAFFISQFSYCPLIRMCCSHTNDRKIERLYEGCLQINYQENQSSFDKLLGISYPYAGIIYTK